MGKRQAMARALVLEHGEKSPPGVYGEEARQRIEDAETGGK
jgi:hypothetical protein